MLSYILKQSHSFFPDAELEDSKLQYNPVPGNATPLDEFLRGVLEKNLKHSQMHRRINFHKIQQLELHVLGPMAKICQKLRILLSVKLIGLKQTCVNLKNLIEQSIIMFGQVFNNIKYSRGLSVLNALMKEHKYKQMFQTIFFS